MRRAIHGELVRDNKNYQMCKPRRKDWDKDYMV